MFVVVFQVINHIAMALTKVNLKVKLEHNNEMAWKWAVNYYKNAFTIWRQIVKAFFLWKISIKFRVFIRN